MSKLDNVLEKLKETYWNPDEQNPDPYLISHAKADILKLVEEELIWGGSGGEPYPSDADFIKSQQIERLKQL